MNDVRKSKREKLQVMAMNIRRIEARIAEIKSKLPLEINSGSKKLMQSSLKINKELLDKMKEEYWREEGYEHG